MNPERITTTAHGNDPDPTRSRIFTVKFYSSPIRTVVTSTPAVARQWVYDLRRNYGREISRRTLVISLGVQWRANFTRSYSIPAATLQICVDKDCLIFQLHHASAVPATLRHLLLDSRITFVGVQNNSDRRALEDSPHNLAVQNLVDLGDDYPRWSMEAMARHLLGTDNVVKPEELRLSNWEAFYLSDEQVQYACVDAHVSYLLAGALGYYPRQLVSNRFYVTDEGGLSRDSDGGRLSEYYTYDSANNDAGNGNSRRRGGDGSFVLKFTYHGGGGGDNRNSDDEENDFYVTLKKRPDGSLDIVDEEDDYNVIA